MKKLTQEEYEKKYKEKNGDNYQILEFSRSEAPVKILHKKCNNIFTIQKASRLSECPFCRKPYNKKDTELFKKEVYSLVGKEYDVLGDYKGSRELIQFKHNSCEFTFYMRAVDFLRGQRCPNCRKNKAIDYDDFKNQVNLISNGEYELIKKIGHKFLIKHVKCGKEILMFHFEFINGRRCPDCNNNHNKRKTTEKFKKELYDLVEDEYLLIGEYNGTNHLNEFKHNNINCKGYGKTFKMKPNAFLSSHHRCPYCFSSKRKTHEDFCNDIEKLVGDEYTVIGKYKNNKTKIKFYHKNCKNYFYMRPNKFLSNNRCPFCAAKKNERQIISLLNKFNITYIYDKPLKSYSTRERFDFQIFKDQKIVAIIEYDGEFHFKPIFGEDRLNKQKLNDSNKNKFCNENDIPLLRIPYNKQNEKNELIIKFLIKNNILPSTTIENTSNDVSE